MGSKRHWIYGINKPINRVGFTKEQGAMNK